MAPSSARTSGALELCKSTITAATSLVAAAMLLRRVVADFLPAGTPLLGPLLLLPPPSSRRHAVVIEEFDGALYNRVFLAARAYVSTLLAAAPGVPPVIKAALPRGAGGADQIRFSMRPGTSVVDVFEGVELTWRLSDRGGRTRSDGGGAAGEVFKLSFEGEHREAVLGAYLPLVMARAEAAAREQRQAKLYSNERRGKWRPVRLRNAATFATLAMDAALRRDVVDDLDRFLERKEYYARTGRVWKRGYLVHGPPGTGKSSLVAAISNHLRFDVYDLDIGNVRSNTELRKLLIRMKNRSILLVEDVDCALATAPRRGDDGGSDEISPPASKNRQV